ncbi:M48 family metalloprotease [Haloarcula sp. JP-L23]|nr:M48 family metalloprotease [Haloarcula sp. JP-L23]
MRTIVPATHSTLRLRLAALLLGLVAFDVVAVVTAYVLVHIAYGLLPMFGLPVGASFWTHGFHLVSLRPAVLAGTPLVLAFQFVFGYRATLREATGGPDLPEASEPETTRERFTAIKHERTLFVTTALVDQLDGDELDAVLAHELAHLKNGDSFVMTAAAFLPIVSARATRWLRTTLETSVYTHWFFDGETSRNAISAAYFYLPLVAFAFLAMPFTAALYLASTACYRLLSRVREYAADAGGAAICGSPAAMASALETLTADRRPTADYRTARTGVRELCVLPYALDEAGDDPTTDRTGGVGRLWRRGCERVLPDSHPDVADRIDALGERQVDVDGGRSRR